MWPKYPVMAEEGSGEGSGGNTVDIRVSSPEASPAGVTPAPEPKASGEDTPSKGGEPSGEEAAPKQPNPGRERLQKRFSELTRDKYEAQARAEAAERRAAELEARYGQKPQGAQPGGEAPAPKLEDFKDYEEYAAARTQYHASRAARQAVQEADTRRSQEQQRQRAIDTASDIRARWETAEAEFKGNVKDYEDVMTSREVQFTDAVSVALLDSDIGPQLAYYLKKNPQEAHDLSRLSPVAAARAIGKLEARLTAKPPAQEPTKAPSPPNPEKGVAPIDDTFDPKLSMDEYVRRGNKQELDRRRNG